MASVALRHHPPAPHARRRSGCSASDMLALARPGLRIVNTARGGILDEAALDAAIRSGRVAGAALDVFDKEPTTESPLFELDSVVVTPHLGASTREAQDKAGETIAEQVQLALSGGFVPYAVNVERHRGVGDGASLPAPGRAPGPHLFASLNDGVPVDPGGRVPGPPGRLRHPHPHPGRAQGRCWGRAARSRCPTSTPPSWPTERGVMVRESKTSEAKDYVNLISLPGRRPRAGRHPVRAARRGPAGDGRRPHRRHPAVEQHGGRPQRRPPGHDRPGGRSPFGRAGINISDMDVGRSPSGEAALMVLSTDRPLPAEVLDELRPPARHPPGARRQFGVRP